MLITYQLIIRLENDRVIRVGKLGTWEFPAGYYSYVGSAKRGLLPRIHRHFAAQKRHHWHIDYLLTQSTARIVAVHLSRRNECKVNATITGDILVRGFGSSDCRHHCESHLKVLSLLSGLSFKGQMG